MTAQTIWIATISTHDETVAVAHDEISAWNLATESALNYLQHRGVTQFKTKQDVADYFSVSLHQIEIGTAEQV